MGFYTIIVLACIISTVYILMRRKRKQNKLHKYNIVKARALLDKLHRGNYAPAYIFGILRNTNWFVFEEFLLLCFKQHGYHVPKRKRYTTDGGIDGVVIDKQGRKFIIQAKRYKSAINPAHVDEFVALIESNRADGGFFIHTGRTGPKSYRQAKNKVFFISGDKLLRLINIQHQN